MKYITKSHSGFALIEVLVAFFIVAVGVSGAVQLSTYLAREASLSRERAQAYALAQQKMSELRNAVTRQQFDALFAACPCTETPLRTFSPNDPTNAYSQEFVRSWNLTADPADANRSIISVTVSWQSAFSGHQTRNNAGQVITEDGARTVTISSSATFSPPVFTEVANSENSGSRPMKITPPSGNAIAAPPGGSLGNAEAGDPTENITGTNVKIGRRGNEFVLIFDGRIVLKSTDQNNFSSISGSIYINAGNYSLTGNQALLRSNFFVAVSDASFCDLSPTFSSSATNSSLYNKIPTSNTKYYEVKYTCFFGSNWYGNIGVLRIDTATTSESTCVGTPSSTGNVTTAANSTAASPSAVRLYRGFSPNYNASCTKDSDGVYTYTPNPNDLEFLNYSSVGIGRLFNSDYPGSYTSAQNVCQPTQDYIPTHYSGHDFLMVKLQGQNTCSTAMTTLKTELASNNIVLDNSAITTGTFGSATTPANYAINTRNPGKNFCFPRNMTESTGTPPQECPNQFPTAVSPTIHLTGNLNFSPNSLKNSTTLSMLFRDVACQIDNQKTEYSCELELPGFSAAGWSETLSATLNQPLYVCATSSQSALATPGYAYVTETNTQQIFLATDITNLNISMNLEIRQTPCN